MLAAATPASKNFLISWFFFACSSLTRAAREMHLHSNTLLYRLKRVRELTLRCVRACQALRQARTLGDVLDYLVLSDNVLVLDLGADGIQTIVDKRVEDTAMVWPHLLVIEFIAAFQIFDVVWTLTSGGQTGGAVNPFTPRAVARPSIAPRL